MTKTINRHLVYQIKLVLLGKNSRLRRLERVRIRGSVGYLTMWFGDVSVGQGPEGREPCR